jgi:hypothetical protein
MLDAESAQEIDASDGVRDGDIAVKTSKIIKQA